MAKSKSGVDNWCIYEVLVYISIHVECCDCEQFVVNLFFVSFVSFSSQYFDSEFDLSRLKQTQTFIIQWNI